MWSRWMRHLHRWVATAFLVVVAAIFATLGLGGEPAEWLYLLPLAPLAVLMGSGLYMLVQPRAGRWRAAWRGNR